MPPKRDREEDADVPDDANCSICLETFKDPVSLPCGHSLCRACVEQVARTSPAGTLKCPECRASTPLPPGGVANLKTNISLRNMIASASAPAPSLFRRCDHHQLERDMFCETCNANICRRCLEDHRGHVLDDLRHNVDGFMARMQPVLMTAKQTMVARLASRRDVHKQALQQQDMAESAVQKAKADFKSALRTRERLRDTADKAKTEYDAVHAENDTFHRNATTLVGVLEILEHVPRQEGKKNSAHETTLTSNSECHNEHACPTAIYQGVKVPETWKTVGEPHGPCELQQAGVPLGYEAMNANLPVTRLAPDEEFVTCDACFQDTDDMIHGVFFRCLDCCEDLCRSCYEKGRHSELHTRIYFMGYAPGDGKRRKATDEKGKSTPRRWMLLDDDQDE